MYCVEDNFRVAMNLLPVVVYMGLSEMINLILARDVEGRLGRKLTYKEWSYYLREYYRKREAECHQRTLDEQYQQYADLKIIHDIIWNNST